MKTKIYKYLKEFGLKIFLVKAIRSKFYNNYSTFGKKLSLYNEKNIKNFLRSNVTQKVSKSIGNNFFVNSRVKKNNVIWIMWWQDIENAPRLVKKCIQNIKENNPNHEIVIITNKNYKQYLHLNERILSLFEDGSISVTHLSDIIRVNLLYLYGGVWIDSTLFSTEALPESIFSKNFYTIKTGNYTNDPSHGRWTTFFIESQAGSDLMKYLSSCFDYYCKKYNLFIDYILFDYFIEIGYEDNKKIKCMIDNVPINNVDTFKLNLCFLKGVENYNFKNSKTFLYKLSYKENYTKKNNNRQTLYYKILGN